MTRDNKLEMIHHEQVDQRLWEIKDEMFLWPVEKESYPLHAILNA